MTYSSAAFLFFAMAVLAAIPSVSVLTVSARRESLPISNNNLKKPGKRAINSYISVNLVSKNQMI